MPRSPCAGGGATLPPPSGRPWSIGSRWGSVSRTGLPTGRGPFIFPRFGRGFGMQATGNISGISVTSPLRFLFRRLPFGVISSNHTSPNFTRKGSNLQKFGTPKLPLHQTGDEEITLMYLPSPLRNRPGRVAQRLRTTLATSPSVSLGTEVP